MLVCVNYCICKSVNSAFQILQSNIHEIKIRFFSAVTANTILLITKGKNMKSFRRMHMNIFCITVPQFRNTEYRRSDIDTGMDWLDYFVQNLQQCQAQSRFAVHSRLDIAANSKIIANPNQAFYCGTLWWDCSSFGSGILSIAGGDILHHDVSLSARGTLYFLRQLRELYSNICYLCKTFILDKFFFNVNTLFKC